nr:multidrug resistance-associated protein 5 [Tanacetum cinerariifolium]
MTIPGPNGIELDVWNDGIFMLDPLRYGIGAMLNMLIARLKFIEYERMIIKETNCANLFAMYYRILDSDLEKGLVKVVNDYDLIHMYDMSKIATPHKRYCNVFTEEEMVSWAEKEAEEEALLIKGKEKTYDVDKGKEKMVVESDSENDKMIEDSDSDDNDNSNKSFDHISAGEEELIQLRNKKANRSDLLRKLKGDGEDSNLHDPFLGKKFVEATELKDCLTYYAISNGYSIWFERSSVDALIAICGQRPPTLKGPSLGKQRKQLRYPSVCKEDVRKCNFRLYVTWMTHERTFQIKSLKPKHNCVRNFKFYSLVDYKWIRRHFGDKIRKNPEIKLCDITDLVMKKYKCTITPNQSRSAKIWALTEYEKTREEQYRLLRSYGKELLC